MGTWTALVAVQTLGAIVVGLLALVLDGWPELTLRVLWLSAVGAVSAYAAYSGLFEALRRGPVAMVTPLISSWAVVTVGIGIARDPSSVNAWMLGGVAMIIVGNVALAAIPAESAANKAEPRANLTRGALIASAISVAGFGVMVPTVDAVGLEVGRLWTVPLIWLPEVLLVIVTRYSDMAPKLIGQQWWPVLGTTVLETGGFVAMGFGMQFAPVAVVGPAASLSTAGAVLMGVIVLRERLNAWQIAAALLAALGVVVTNL